MTYQAKQQASELCFNHRDWTDHLPDGYAVETRINLAIFLAYFPRWGFGLSSF